MHSCNREIIQPDYLIDFAAGDPGFIKDMIEVFLSDAPRQIAQIAELGGNARYEELSDQAHKLLSSTRFIGAVRMTEIAAILEAECAESNPDPAKTSRLILELEIQFQIAGAELIKLKGS